MLIHDKLNIEESYNTDTKSELFGVFEDCVLDFIGD